MGSERQLSFAEHIRELRGRIMWSLLFMVIGAGVGYGMHDRLLQVLQRPLHDTLYYTTPTGAFSFIIKICVVFGIIVALPMMIYQAFAFFGPLIKARTRRQFVGYVLTSIILAGIGILFAYYISLPAALSFLVNFGADKGNIEALITADEYFNFVLTYIAGFAILFQLPLIISFINRIKPLQPKQLVKQTKYVILVSFIVAAIITPTPDPFNQFIMAGPMILLYFGSACMIAIVNAKARGRERRLRDITPHIEAKTIDDILDSLPTQPRPAEDIALLQPAPVPLVSRPIQHDMRTIRPRMSRDMLTTPQASRPVISAHDRRVRRTMQHEVSVRSSSYQPQTGLISDFVPAK